MKSKKFILFILLPLLTMLLILSLHWFHANHAENLISSFFEDIGESNNSAYENYIHPRFEGDLGLAEFLSKNAKEVDFKILSSRRINMKEYRISVELKHRANSIPISFMVIKDDGRWLISHMPEYVYIPAALFIENVDSSESHSLKFDIKGTISPYSSPHSLYFEKWTPMSLHIIDDYILSYKILSQSHVSRVMKYGNNIVEDMYLGNIEIAPDMPVYIEKSNNLIYSQNSFIPVGIRDVHLYLDDNNIAQLAVYDSQTLYRDKIRVLINDSNHKNKTHMELNMLCNGAYIVKEFTGDHPLEFKFDRGDKMTFKPSQDGIQLYNDRELLATTPNRWHVTRHSADILYLLNIQREFSKKSDKGTSYRGDFEISKVDDELILINEISIEEYLPSVVTSEMPVSFGLEALKVQAICARAYAVAALNRVGFASYGAHLDDSTASQMYNNTSEHSIALDAVESTKGMVPLYEDEIVDTRFFSTSPGYTASSNEVWSHNDGTFPGIESPYLVAKPQYIGDNPGLYNDDNFRAFIDNVNNTSYDRFSPFFRWSVKFTREMLEATINENLSKVQAQQSQFVLTRVGDNYHTDIPIPEDIGKLLNIGVISRGYGGNIMELELSTTSGNYKIIKELNIRNVLKPIGYTNSKPIEVKCYDESVRQNFPLLPSAFAYFDITRDSDGDIVDVSITGGGYGHGVGMSQYGTYGLTLLGKTYKEILEHYYPGSQLEQIY